MKKRFTFIACLAIILCAANRLSAQTILSEGFEADSTLPAGWLNIDSDGDGWDWKFLIGATTANTGTGYAQSHSSYESGGNYYPLTPNNYLVSPAIDLTGYTGTITLSWFVDPSANTAAYTHEHYKVVLSTTTADTNAFAFNLFEETLEPSAWTQKTVDISNYAGSTVYIAWVHYNCTDMDRLKLDDILVEHTSNIGEVSQAKSKMSISPNIVKDDLNIFLNSIESGKAEIRIIDVAGRIVYTQSGTNVLTGFNKITLNVADLPNGIYYARISCNNKPIVAKFIKQ